MAPPYGRIAERRILQQLLRANAVAPSSAHGVELRRALEHRRLKRLVGSGLIVEATPGRYYVDAPRLAEYLDHRRRRVIAASLALIAAALLFLFLF